MYVTVSTTGTVTFRYDYRLNGWRETLTIGWWDPSGISLAMAREKRRLTAAKNFGGMTAGWLAGVRMVDGARAMRKSELIEATWDEVDFESATWTIPVCIRPVPRCLRIHQHA